MNTINAEKDCLRRERPESKDRLNLPHLEIQRLSKLKLRITLKTTGKEREKL